LGEREQEAGAPKRKRDSAGTRARILKVATREFASKGYEGAKTDEIAARADINKRMIYHYFSSKDRLYLAVLEEAYGKARAAERSLDLERVPPLEAIARLAEFTFDSFRRDRTFINLLAIENRQKAKVLKTSGVAAELNSPVIALLSDILARGEAEGSIRAGLDPLQLWISITGVSYFFFSNIFTLSVIFRQDMEAEDMAAERRRHVVEFVLAAVRP
jgi:TetR/AcrR family transcriptional regulator